MCVALADLAAVRVDDEFALVAARDLPTRTSGLLLRVEVPLDSAALNLDLPTAVIRDDMNVCLR